ncbi:MAG: tetratricopeptide repeat protein [Gammaproteobacteria bacterium]|nr:tetratricopeptide repeat protein [Gammaproteobacteria bacterium]MCP5137327.1 tetratricopeptide repeat protein [Gammaproteobacteria bacterium]
MAQQTFIFDGNAGNFAELVRANSDKGPVLVHFWAPYAGPSFKLYGVLEEVAKALAGRFLLVNVNVEKEKALAQEFSIASVPTLKLFRRGDVVETLYGPQPKEDIRRMIERFVPRESDEVMVAALKQYNAGETERCFTALAQAALDDPDNLRIPLTLAKLLVREDRQDDALRLLDSLPREARVDPDVANLHTHLQFMQVALAAPGQSSLEEALEQEDDLAKRHQLAALYLMDDNYQGALDQLFHILQVDRGFRDDLGRRGMLAIFHLLRDQGELVNKYRKKLFRALH